MKIHVSTMRFSCHAYARCVCILHMANIAIANIENTENHGKKTKHTCVPCIHDIRISQTFEPFGFPATG